MRLPSRSHLEPVARAAFEAPSDDKRLRVRFAYIASGALRPDVALAFFVTLDCAFGGRPQRRETGSPGGFGGDIRNTANQIRLATPVCLNHRALRAAESR
jgi:hypothetical protein